jgi:hypothetical protein
VDVEKLSVNPWLSSLVSSAECFPTLHLMKICFPKKQMVPKSKAKVNVHNLSGKVKILDVLKGGMSLAEVGQC